MEVYSTVSVKVPPEMIKELQMIELLPKGYKPLHEPLNYSQTGNLNIKLGVMPVDMKLVEEMMYLERKKELEIMRIEQALEIKQLERNEISCSSSPVL